MKDLIYKTQSIDDTKIKYLNKISDEFIAYERVHFLALYDLEKVEYSDELKLKIEAVGEITANDINTYFNSLFNANSSSNYFLIIKKIQEYLTKNKIKLTINDEKHTVKLLNYDKIEDYILNEIKTFINGFKLPLTFDYQLKRLTEQQEETKQTKQTTFYGVEYSNMELIPTLLNKVVLALPLLGTIIDLHGLLSVQQIDFSTSQYLAIKDCFVKVKNTKVVRLDIKNIIDLLDKSNNDDVLDILSEEYITFVATLLESAYFLCKYFISINEEQINNVRVIHKNELPLQHFIEENIEL